jgi:hypothetical protein
MTKVIISGGCSFAYGYGLNDRNKKYASLLAEKTGAELVDVSVSGSSNENIATSVVYGLNQSLKKHKPENIIVIIGWTEIARMEYWDKSIARLQSCFLHGFIPKNTNSSRHQLLRNTQIFVEKHMWDPCFSYYKLLHAFNYVNSLCKLHGVSVIHLQNLNIIKAKMTAGPVGLTSMRCEYYTDGVLSVEDEETFNAMCDSVSFSRFLFNLYHESVKKYLPEQLLVKPNVDNHPNELGHQLWAEEIFNKHQSIFLS